MQTTTKSKTKDNCIAPDGFLNDLEILVKRYFNGKESSLKGLLITGAIIGEDHNHAIKIESLTDVTGLQVAKGIFDLIEAHHELIDDLHGTITTKREHNPVKQ